MLLEGDRGKGVSMAWNRSRAKYGNRKVVVDGITFDSKKEAQRYTELKLLEKAGKITSLCRQIEFELIPAQREITDQIYTKGPNKGKFKPGKVIEHKCSYVADFVYWDLKNNCMVVEDTKGVRTTEYIIKRKLMLYMRGIRIKEV